MADVTAKLVEALRRIADPRNAHFAGDAQVVAREALAAYEQAQAEPVAWMIRSRTGLIRCCLTDGPDDERRALAEIEGDTITPLFAAPVALAATPAPAPDAPLRDAQEQPFEEWWEREGQFCRSGGGGYEKTFAWNAWGAALAATPAPAPQPVQDERAAFEAWLRRNPNARLWNATDAMFAAFLGGLAATPAPAPDGYVAAEIYAAWRKVGADVCGLKWDAFVDALRAGQGKEAK